MYSTSLRRSLWVFFHSGSNEFIEQQKQKFGKVLWNVMFTVDRMDDGWSQMNQLWILYLEMSLVCTNSRRFFELPQRRHGGARIAIHLAFLTNKLCWDDTSAYWTRSRCYMKEQEIVNSKVLVASLRVKVLAQRLHHKHSSRHSSIPHLLHVSPFALSAWLLLPQASPLDTSKSFPYFLLNAHVHPNISSFHSGRDVQISACDTTVSDWESGDSEDRVSVFVMESANWVCLPVCLSSLPTACITLNYMKYTR